MKHHFVTFFSQKTNSCQLHLQELSSDSSQHVRSALASVIMGMAPVLGKVLFVINIVSRVCCKQLLAVHES
jgi:hypothetical protein